MMIVACAVPWKWLLMHPTRMLDINAFLNTVHLGYHNSCHRNGHRDKHEALVVVGMFTNEVEAPLGCHVNSRREIKNCLLLPRQFSMEEKAASCKVCPLFHWTTCYVRCRKLRVENSKIAPLPNNWQANQNQKTLLLIHILKNWQLKDGHSEK